MFHDGFMGGMGYGWIFWVVILAVIIWGVVRGRNLMVIVFVVIIIMKLVLLVMLLRVIILGFYWSFC